MKTTHVFDRRAHICLPKYTSHLKILGASVKNFCRYCDMVPRICASLCSISGVLWRENLKCDLAHDTLSPG